MSTIAPVNRRRHESRDEIVIRPATAALRIDPREYYRYRHLFFALIRRNIKEQFDAMYFGFVWVFMRPLLYVFVFVMFRRLSSANTHVAIPYALYVYSGLILWYYLTDSIQQTAGALKTDAAILTKVYYPRLLTPLVPSIANIAALGCALVPAVAMMVWYGITPSWRLALLPAVLLHGVLLTVGVGTFFASITLTNRDLERVLTFSLYLGLFVSPVIYAPEMIPSAARAIYALNPMVGLLLAFRSVLFEAQPFPFIEWLYSAGVALIAFIVGISVFRSTECHFADRL